jgi:hypothetical protein
MGGKGEMLTELVRPRIASYWRVNIFCFRTALGDWQGGTGRHSGISSRLPLDSRSMYCIVWRAPSRAKSDSDLRKLSLSHLRPQVSDSYVQVRETEGIDSVPEVERAREADAKQSSSVYVGRSTIASIEGSFTPASLQYARRGPLR